jgi:hypothetical protein
MKRRHGDNKTENKLIIFADGSYIELIAFIDDDPKLRDGHWSVLHFQDPQNLGGAQVFGGTQVFHTRG